MIEELIKTGGKDEIMDITARVQKAVADSSIAEGMCHLYVPHTTAAITVNENADPDVKRDVLMALGKLVPDDPMFRHAEGNSSAHLKSILVGSSVALPISQGKLFLGTWGGVYFCEFDGPRSRKVLIRLQGTDKAGRQILV